MLENEADAASRSFQRRGAGPAQLLAEDLNAAFLGRAQRANQCQHRGLAGPRRSGDDHDLSFGNLGTHVVENLLAQRARAEEVAQVAHDDGRGAGHQNTSAGSSRRTLRTASNAETVHIASVMTNTAAAREGVMYKGMRVASAAVP